MSQKIVKLKIKDFMRIVAVEIEPDGNLVKICGDNMQGKSSLIEGLACVFLGQKYHPSDPIRHGANGAELVGETETLRVERSWDAKRGHRVKVKRKDGAPLDGSPQDVLDRICAGITFDPWEFANLPAKEQVRMLRQATGLDTTTLDAKRKQIFERRTSVNSEHRALEAQLHGIKLPAEPAPVPEEMDLAEIAGKKGEAERTRAENERTRQDLYRAREDEAVARDKVVRLRRELQAAEDMANALAISLKEAEESVADLVDPDTSAIDAQIATARTHNARVRELCSLHEQHKAKKQQAERLKKLADAKRDASDDYTRQLEEIDSEKARMLAAVKLPLPGMTIDGDEIRVNGHTIEQCSDAQKIKLGLEIYAGLNPELRVARIKNGSLLSKNSMAMLADWVREKDMQVWLEVVDSCEDGITIEDGRIASHEEPADDDSELAAAVPGTDDSRASG